MKRIINYPLKTMRKIYDWTVGWAHKKSSNYALFIIAFMESSFFPVPPDVLLIPLVVAHPKSWWKKALICTTGSVAGAFLGYLIGYLFFETVGAAIVNFYDLRHVVESVGKMYSDNALLAIFGGAFTPIPYKVFTLAAGFFQISLFALFAGSVLGRGGRFFIVAGAIRIFGKQIQYVIEKYFNILSLVFFVLLVAGFVAVKYLL
ncbi:YqaA family protein [Endomicrobium proavitum]|uniref:Alkaline phosphatase PhoA n=1 Tax=Endomicrobium proavitum TaxID=1408281 RepID=A0A0G3WIP4_9BACT|nr:YqaA family protein [Endomicrobium proavitum]AKL98183.1 Alkaline phosphatase PhoA [Endomicrobium proavitum]